MKKFLFLILAIPLSFLGCANNDDSSDDADTESVVWSQDNSGYAEKVLYAIDTEDGIVSTSVSYSIKDNETGKGLAFGIVKMTSGTNTIYKAAIVALKQGSAFPESYWDSYILDLGQSTITMTDAIGGPDTNDSGYEYLIVGGISANQLAAFKNANQITVTLQKSDDASRKTTFVVDYEFVKALLKYL